MLFWGQGSGSNLIEYSLFTAIELLKKIIDLRCTFRHIEGHKTSSCIWSVLDIYTTILVTVLLKGLFYSLQTIIKLVELSESSESATMDLSDTKSD